MHEKLCRFLPEQWVHHSFILIKTSPVYDNMIQKISQPHKMRDSLLLYQRNSA